MRFTSKTIVDGVSEKIFIIDDISGVLWSPIGATGIRPLIMLGHGGGQHKKAPGVLARAHRYVTACGFNAVAIDAPGHGDRPKTAEDERHAADLRQRMAAGEPVGPQIARYNATVSATAVDEWRSTLDAIQEVGLAAAPWATGAYRWAARLAYRSSLSNRESAPLSWDLRVTKR